MVHPLWWHQVIPSSSDTKTPNNVEECTVRSLKKSRSPSAMWVTLNFLFFSFLLFLDYLKKGNIKCTNNWGVECYPTSSQLISEQKVIDSSLPSLSLSFLLLSFFSSKRMSHHPNSLRLPSGEYLAMNRAFAEGYIKFKDLPEVRAFSKQVRNYQQQLRAYGLKVTS